MKIGISALNRLAGADAFPPLHNSSAQISHDTVSFFSTLAKAHVSLSCCSLIAQPRLVIKVPLESS